MGRGQGDFRWKVQRQLEQNDTNEGARWPWHPGPQQARHSPSPALALA
jgi:hypothetical protein